MYRYIFDEGMDKRGNYEENLVRVFRTSKQFFIEAVHVATKIPFIYSFSGNCVASVPISTFIPPLKTTLRVWCMDEGTLKTPTP
jgi:hypothetical protein